MISESDLKRLYDHKLVSVLDELEGRRKELLNDFWSSVRKSLLFIISFLVFAFYIDDYLYYLFIPSEFFYVLYVAFFIVALYFIWRNYFYLDDIYRKEYKEKIVLPIVYVINPNLTYKSSSFVSKYIFDNSKLFNPKYNRYNGDDYIGGIINDISIEFSELHVTDKIGKSTIDIFHGLFFAANIGSVHSTEIFIYSLNNGRLPSVVTEIHKLKNYPYGEPVDITYQNFNHKFLVLSRNEEQTRAILTTSLLDKILLLKQSFLFDVLISIRNSHLYVGISFPGNKLSNIAFEPSLFKSIQSFDVVRSNFNMLKSFINLIEEFQK